MKYWFTGDTHFGHDRILLYQPKTRGHFKDIAEHDRCLIENWNSVVKNSDIVIHVGDFAFGNKEFCIKIREKLKGNIFMIPGNHDSVECIKKTFSSYKETIKVKINEWTLYCSHYPHITWPSRHETSIHCHGHSHGFYGHNLSIKRFDVGIDCWNLSPVSFETLKNLAINQEDYQI